MEVKCEKLDHFGRGLGFVDNKIVFIPNLLPGEKALIKITKEKKKYMTGEVIKYILKSEDRTKQKCPYLNCGCPLMNLNYEKTLEFKLNKVKEIFKKYHLDENLIKKILSSKNIYNYRNKITLKVKNGKLGYFKNETNELIPIKKCLIASLKTNEIIKTLSECDLSLVKEIIIKDFDETMISIKGKMNITKLKPLVNSIYMNDKLVYGNNLITTNLDKYKFYISKDSFFQVNNDVALKLYNQVLNYLGKGEEVLDLYSGTGTISLFISSHFKKVIGIEINKEAVKCALLNKKLNKIDNVDFICGDVSKQISNLKADKIVVDPPRSGLTKNGISDILKINPKIIVYVSCDPMTLVRDIDLLSKQYKLKEVTLFDMFPWSYHVESVCLFTLKKNF